MKSTIIRSSYLALITAALALPTSVMAGDDKDDDKKVKLPWGLEIVDKVQYGATDEASKIFFTQDLPKLSELVSTTLYETKAINDATIMLDPSKLVLKNESDVRVYFVGEGAGYHNILGFSTDGGSPKGKEAAVIFPDASSLVSPLTPQNDMSVKRTSSEPLLPGDFVDLGEFKAGTKLDFFLIADGANGGKNVYSTDSSVNSDGINHVVSFAAISGSYLLIGFEDMFKGGDRDFNDVIFAVDIGAKNLAALTATPEPATYAMLGTFLALGGWAMRRRNATQA